VNQAFFWYCEEGGESGIVHDLVKAKGLVEAYSQLRPPQYFEIVEVTDNEHPPSGKGEFLGFDLSAGYRSSLLSWGLEVDRALPTDLPENDLVETLQPLLSLVRQYFQPQLNSNGLFDNFHAAKFCLACMEALQTIRPGLWENEDVRFEVVSLWRILSE
jgi:hypothetical protein